MLKATLWALITIALEFASELLHHLHVQFSERDGRRAFPGAPLSLASLTLMGTVDLGVLGRSLTAPF